MGMTIAGGGSGVPRERAAWRGRFKPDVFYSGASGAEARVMETDAKRLARLRTMAGERGLDVVRDSNNRRESGRGWHLIIIGGLGTRCGSTLDEIEFYLDKF
jgi:hypothetical protein